MSLGALVFVSSLLTLHVFLTLKYMASVEKQLLGTETARALRAKGIASRICGLSANNMETAFIEAGADSFLLKPIPCKRQEIVEELKRILF